MKNLSKILLKLDKELESLEATVEDILVKSEKGIKLSKNTLNEIRNSVVNKKFENINSEIQFFKITKPKILSKLIYFVKLFNIESKRPRSSNKSQVKYLNQQIDRLQVYFNDNLEFYQYYRRGATHLDNHYFIRGKTNIRLHPDSFHFLTDENFSTSHDSTVATILAYDMLIIYLKQEIDKLENTNTMEAAIQAKQSKLFWTASKTDLIELIYALHSSGAINRGTVDIKEMAVACERLFNVDLGHYYHTFIELKSRKTNRTKFLDSLRDSLENRMNESDE